MTLEEILEMIRFFSQNTENTNIYIHSLIITAFRKGWISNKDEHYLYFKYVKKIPSMPANLCFEWESGSLNQNAIKLFKKNELQWEYDKHGQLTVDFLGQGLFEEISYSHLYNDIYTIHIKFAKNTED